MLVDLDAGMIPGHDKGAQDGQCPVIARGGGQAGGAVGWFGGLHVVYAGVDEHVLQSALNGVLQVDTADARIIVSPDIQILDDHMDRRELPVNRIGRTVGRDDGGA